MVTIENAIATLSDVSNFCLIVKLRILLSKKVGVYGCKRYLIKTLCHVKTVWIKGKTKLTPELHMNWYTACLNCQKLVYADIEWTIRCPSYKEKTQVEAR